MRRKKDPAVGFLLGWAIGPMILLECVRTKLVHYYLPAYPACALLVALARGGRRRLGAEPEALAARAGWPTGCSWGSG